MPFRSSEMMAGHGFQKFESTCEDCFDPHPDPCELRNIPGNKRQFHRLLFEVPGISRKNS
jgi:hypothetical protein